MASSQTSNDTVSVTLKKKVTLTYGCYICGTTRSTARSTIKHMRRIHGYTIPIEKHDCDLSQDEECIFVSDKEQETDATYHYACPSCPYHCIYDDLESLFAHTVKKHFPRRVEEDALIKDGEEEDDDEEDEEETDEFSEEDYLSSD